MDGSNNASTSSDVSLRQGLGVRSMEVRGAKRKGEEVAEWMEDRGIATVARVQE